MGVRSLHLRAGHTGVQPVVDLTIAGSNLRCQSGRGGLPQVGAYVPGPIVWGMSETPPVNPDFDSMTRDIAEVPAVEVIVTVAVNLMSAAAVKLGLTEEETSTRTWTRPASWSPPSPVCWTRPPPRSAPSTRPAARRPEVAAAGVPRGVGRAGRAGSGSGREVHGPGLRLGLRHQDTGRAVDRAFTFHRSARSHRRTYKGSPGGVAPVEAAVPGRGRVPGGPAVSRRRRGGPPRTARPRPGPRTGR